jgi:hypothetical protein
MLGAAVGETVEISPLAPRSLRDVLSPNAGYPSEYGMGGAVDFEAFTNGMIGVADRIVRLGGWDGDGDGECGATTSYYDSMDKEELLEVCASRGMTT